MLKHLPPTATPFSARVLSSLGVGKRPSSTFKSQLKQYLNTPHVYLASSGRTVLYILLTALKRANPTRQEVLLPAYTCPVLAKVIIDAGLRPVFIDISPQNLSFDPVQLSENLTHSVLAIICVHPFGIPQAIDEVAAKACSAGAFVIEDGAQSLGALWRGQPVGLTGDFGMFSLGPGKPLSTGGGGILCTRHDDYAALLDEAWEQLRPDSTTASGFSLLRYLGLTAVFHPRLWYWMTRLKLQQAGNHEAGWGYSLQPLAAAQQQIGAFYLPQLEENNARRHRHAEMIMAGAGLSGKGHFVETAVDATAIYLRLPFIANTPELADGLYGRLWAKGIGVGRMYQKTLPELFPQVGNLPHPGARQVAHCLLTLPTHHYLTTKNIDDIVNIMR